MTGYLVAHDTLILNMASKVSGDGRKPPTAATNLIGKALRTNEAMRQTLTNPKLVAVPA